MNTDIRRVVITEDDFIEDDPAGDHILLGTENFTALSNVAADGKIAAVGYDEIRARLVVMFKLDARCAWAWDKACKMMDPNEREPG
jgi:hypothetical protein